MPFERLETGRMQGPWTPWLVRQLKRTKCRLYRLALPRVEENAGELTFRECVAW